MTAGYFGAQWQRILTAAQKVAGKRHYDVLFFSLRPEYFDADEFRGLQDDRIRSVVFASTFGELQALRRTFDIIIMCSSVSGDDRAALCTMRAQNLADLVVVWTFDNHHDWHLNLIINAMADIVIPAHRFCADYMRSPSTILGAHVPLATSQWSRAKAKILFDGSMKIVRCDGLHGSFVRWFENDDRAKLATACRGRLPDNAIRVMELKERNSYFDQTSENRWLDWARYKVELVLPLGNDLSFRFFDSLLIGQVPLVPSWCRDLDAVIPVAMQHVLPVIRFEEAKVEAVEKAWREGVRRFDEDGEAGMVRRHKYALEQHHLANRITAICNQISDVAQRDSVQFMVDSEGAGFVL